MLEEWVVVPRARLGSISLGSHRDALRREIGGGVEEVAQPFEPVPVDYFRDRDIRVSYSSELNARYIESGSVNGSRQVVLEGVPLLGRAAKDVVCDLRRVGQRVSQNYDDPYGYFLLDAGVVLNTAYSDPKLVDSAAVFSSGLYDAMNIRWVDLTHRSVI